MAEIGEDVTNGMPPIFYQHYWSEIGEDVTQAVLSCLNAGKIPSSVNHNFITLMTYP